MSMTAKYTISAVSEAQAQGQGLFRYITPDLILPNPKQPRRTLEPEAFATLRESIRERGILQPLLVMRGEEGHYVLIAGQRRLAAARELGLVRVPVMIMNEARPDYLVDSLLENIQREELSGIDEGQSFIALKEEFGWSQREIAARIHKHESYVSERIRTAERLTTITKEIISDALDDDENLARAKFSHSINRKLALLPASDQEELARLVASSRNITARQIEELVRQKQRTSDANSVSTLINKIVDINTSTEQKKVEAEKHSHIHKTRTSKSKIAPVGQMTLDAVWGKDLAKTNSTLLFNTETNNFEQPTNFEEVSSENLENIALTKMELEIDLNAKDLANWPQLAKLLGTCQSLNKRSSKSRNKLQLSQILKALGL